MPDVYARPLREVRAEQLLSIRELAHLAGVAPSTIHLTETGRTTPHPSVMRRIAAALAIDAREIEEFRRTIEARAGQAQQSRLAPPSARSLPMDVRRPSPPDRPDALDPLEREVAALIAEGLADGEIDSRLGVAPGTTASYVEAALRRLELRARVQAGRWVMGHRSVRTVDHHLAPLGEQAVSRVHQQNGNVTVRRVEQDGQDPAPGGSEEPVQ